MGNGRANKRLGDAGPSGSDVLGGVGTGLGLVSSMLPGTAGDVLGFGGSLIGLGNLGQSEDPSVLGALSSVTSIAGGLAGFMEADGASSVFGGLGSGLGVVSGIAGAADDTASGADRVVSGLDAYGNGLSLAANVMTGGEFSLTAAGSGLGGASTLLGTSVGEIAAAGGSTVLGAGGAVVGAGVAGYGLGTVINDAGTSDGARHQSFGEDLMTGQDRTAVEAWTDFCIEQATDRENDAWREARGLERGGAAANEWIDQATGTDALGDAVEFGADTVAGIHEWVGMNGAQLAGGVATAVGAIPAAAFGAGISLGRWSEEAMGEDNARAVRGGIRGLGSGLANTASGAMSALGSLWD